MVRCMEISFENRVPIRTLRKQGCSLTETADKSDCCKSVPYYVFKTYQQIDSVGVYKRAGRPKMFSEKR